MTVAELVCELMYAGKTRAEIASYDDAFMRWVLCRSRDENGGLIRVSHDLPSWVTANLNSRGQWSIRNPKPFSAMFHQVMRHQGLDEQERRQTWNRWQADNPGFGLGG